MTSKTVPAPITVEPANGSNRVSCELPPRSPYLLQEPFSRDGVSSPTDSVRQQILKPLKFSLDDSVSKICVVRQTELYCSPHLNEASDLFAVSSSNIDKLKRRIGAVDIDDGSTDALTGEYWKAVLDDRYNQFIRDGHIDELDSRIIKGIPPQLRALVYLKTMQVRYNINHKETYDNLLSRAKQSRSSRTLGEKGGYIDRLNLEPNLKDILRIFIYYTNEVVGTARSELPVAEASDDIMAPSTPQDIQPPNYFVIHICKIISQIPGLDNEEILYLLLKFNKLFCNLVMDEFFYKINRGLEQLLPQVFKHIAKNGINLVVLYKKVLYNFFTDKFGDDSALTLKILDLFVFQGFDFLLRLVLYCFQCNQSQILDLEGDSLHELLNSHAFWNVVTVASLPEVLHLEPKIIKYENEFHLIYANSFNNKNNELINLRETNDDLIIKVNELRQQLASLKTTHEEILQQNTEYRDQLAKDIDVRKQLDGEREQLRKQYEHLTMTENVTNTKKANDDFERRNQDLERQIEQLKKSIAQKKAKLGRS